MGTKLDHMLPDIIFARHYSFHIFRKKNLHSEKKRLFLLCILACIINCTNAQVKWRDDSIPFNKIEWNNMSTSYFSDDADKMIALVTAIPYNGIDFIGMNKELDLFYTSSYYKYQSNLSNHFQKLDTYDSGNVYFVTPGIFKNNADSFEFRILKDGKVVMKPWCEITQFTDSNFQLNSFRKFCGFLGGYHTGFNHFITVELRRKNNLKNIAESSVYWKQIHPHIASVYTSDDLNIFLKRLKSAYTSPEELNESKKYTEEYSTIEDSLNHRAKMWIFNAGESNLIFYLNASIYWKGALEYSLLKNGKVVKDWQPNDYDNNFVWLHNLSNGNYELKMRYRMQRPNVSTYLFKIKPFWYQTNAFVAACIIFGLLLLTLIIFFILSRRRLALQKTKTQKLQLELRSVRSQLNPHFVFNALSSIQSLLKQSKLEEADYYFTEFSSLLRDTMRNNEKEMLPLHIELQTIETYVKLEQLRFAFKYQIKIEDIDTSAVEVPSLLLQPIIENAVKHGISKMRKEGEIILSVTSKGKDMIITIMDNGNGFSPSQQTEGFGLKLTKERLNLINQTLIEQYIDMHIESKAIATTVLFTFKNWL